ncbi:hypothetical protein LOZ66_005816 [Ophidiomyces ophidiicola]|nr:hypothetical protein LOZ66_005816 [Ophidiomyces ophidiicola]
MAEEIATMNAEARGEYNSCQLPFYKPWEADVIGWGCSGRVYRFDENIFPNAKNYAMNFFVMHPARPEELESSRKLINLQKEIYARFQTEGYHPRLLPIIEPLDIYDAIPKDILKDNFRGISFENFKRLWDLLAILGLK